MITSIICLVPCRWKSHWLHSTAWFPPGENYTDYRNGNQRAFLCCWKACRLQKAGQNYFREPNSGSLAVEYQFIHRLCCQLARIPALITRTLVIIIFYYQRKLPKFLLFRNDCFRHNLLSGSGITKAILYYIDNEDNIGSQLHVTMKQNMYIKMNVHEGQSLNEMF